MKLYITEKHDVARDLARLVGAHTRRDGYYEGPDCRVTWTIGHLCCLKEPNDYTKAWKQWSLGALPMIPQRFGIKLINNKGREHQFHVIEQLGKEADEIINCGDAGQEGELIQRWVMLKAGVKCPVKRLWTSSLTDEALLEGLANLKPDDHYLNLYHAGMSRAIGDWLLGMNCTRLYSLKYSTPGNVLSIGRVQTPTLALVVQRHREITNFKPEDYYELKSVYRDTTFSATAGKIKSLDEAEAIRSALAGKDMTITDVQEKEGRESAPRLFDLTSLQYECNRKWGWSANETLEHMQSLYEKKVTTYPRVDTTYLSEDIHAKVPGILANMTPYANLTAPILNGKIAKSKRIFDNSKVTDHHAIIPTGQSPSVLVGDDRKLYHLIAMRFIAAFYPQCRFNTTTVMGNVDNISFKATGKVITDPGWRKLYASESKSADNDGEDAILPEFTVGEHGPQMPSVVKKTTQPPKYYTEGTLILAMESAGKTVDDESLREALKENGIGRPSTRGAIIETLFKRKYIQLQRKSVVPTQAGIDLIDSINEELLKSAKLTGLWENKLRRIERGTYSAAEFIDELKTLVGQIVLNVMADNSRSKIIVEQTPPQGNKQESSTSPKATKKPRAPRITRYEQLECPLCHSGHIVKGHTAFGCSRHKEGCGLRLFFAEWPETLTPSKLKKKMAAYKPT